VLAASILLGSALCLAFVVALSALLPSSQGDGERLIVPWSSFLLASLALACLIVLTTVFRKQFALLLGLLLAVLLLPYAWLAGSLGAGFSLTDVAGNIIIWCLVGTAFALMLRRAAREWYGFAAAPPRADALARIVPGEWRQDPYRRHDLRYWDGTSWTAWVPDAGLVAPDPLWRTRADVQAARAAQSSVRAPSVPSDPAPRRSRRKLIVAAAALAALVIVLAVGFPHFGSGPDYSDPGPLPSRGVARGDSPQAKALAKPLSEFGCDLLLRQAEATDGNVVISPVSLACMLSMIGNGAEGETKKEVAGTLGVDGLDPVAVNQGWADLITSAQSGKKATVTVCNSLWLRDGMPFKPAFLNVNREYFAADCEPLDDDDEVAVREINQWVHDRTSGKLPPLFKGPQLDPLTYLVAVNTVNLKVGWDLFKKKDTKPQPFTLTSGAVVSVPMMSRFIETKGDDEFPVVERRDFNAVCLKTDGPVDVWVIVPQGRRTPEDIVRTLDRRGGVPALYAWSHRTSMVSIGLPRFDFTYQSEDETLKRDLMAMGIKRLFDDRAELQGIAETPLRRFFLTRIAHTARLKVDEEGVEAQAASGGMGGCGAGPTSIYANRPFVVVLAERGCQAPLFLAIVRDPR
jgi:serpin B